MLIKGSISVDIIFYTHISYTLFFSKTTVTSSATWPLYLFPKMLRKCFPLQGELPGGVCVSVVYVCMSVLQCFCWQWSESRSGWVTPTHCSPAASSRPQKPHCAPQPSVIIHHILTWQQLHSLLILPKMQAWVTMTRAPRDVLFGPVLAEDRSQWCSGAWRSGYSYSLIMPSNYWFIFQVMYERHVLLN